MSMKARSKRKINKLSNHKHISIEQRQLNKDKDGMPSRNLSKEERRYVAVLNKYARVSGEKIEYEKSFLVAGF